MHPLMRRHRPDPPASSESTRAESFSFPVEASGGLSASWEGDALVIRDYRAFPIWAKVTGRSGAMYAWTQIDEGDVSDFDTELSSGFAATGTATTNGAPAYEVNGRADVPTDTRVHLWPAGDYSYYLFEYTSPGSSSGVYGQAFSVPGEVVLWNDETGQWVKGAPGWRFREGHSAFGRPSSQFTFTLPNSAADFLFDTAPPHPGQFSAARDLGTLSQSFSPLGISLDYDWAFDAGHACGSGTNAAFRSAHFNGTQLTWVRENFRFQNNDTNGFIWTVPDSANSRVVRYHTSTDVNGFQYWMAHYTSDGTAGTTDGSTFEEGLKVGKESAVADLAGAATLADTIAKVNEIISRLESAGIIST